MKNIILSLVAVSSVSAFAFINPFASLRAGDAICYGREYSDSHLKSNPKQTVKRLQLKLQKESQYGSKMLFVEAVLKGEANKYKLFKTVMGCDDNGECFIDCDGGTAKVAVDSLREVLTFKNEGITLQGGCGSEEENFVTLSAEPGSDDVFKTYKLRPEFCQAEVFGSEN